MKTAFKIVFTLICFTAFISCKAEEKTGEQLLAANETPKTSKQYIKVALLLDTSNSMDGLIDQAKSQLWKIVNELSYAKCDDAKPNLQIAIYEYGNDNLNSKEGYIRQVLSFSEDLDEISKQLFSLTTKGGNEYCGQVILTALDQLNWKDNPDDLKLIFIAGNEPFDQGEIQYTSATKNATTKGVTVNTIFCGNYEQGIASRWKNGADLAGGNYIAINHNEATTYIATPYDDAILNYNKKLNKTYIAYGKLGQQKMKLQANQDMEAESYGESNAVSRTVSKGSHLYKNDSWDLVDASKKESFNYSSLKEEDLPNELKGKNKEEIRTYISKKKTERKRIQVEIEVLNKKRKAFIETQQKDNTNGLESAMIKAIKTQAKKKNYKWE